MQKEQEEELKIVEGQSDEVVAKDLPSVNQRFETLGLIGSGGMGSVYKIKDRENGSIFAMKLLRPELATDNTCLKRFEKEAEAAGRITHPNLVSVYDHGSTGDGTPYMIMEYVDGKTLAERLKSDGPLSVDQAIDLFEQIAEAVQQAHKMGIVHRDLKPSNVILKGGDKSMTPKVTDFGIASINKESEGETVTKTGDIVGSPHYMSPEQCLGAELDARTDIYSLGCLMYATLSGKPPFDSSNPVQVILSHINEMPPRLAAKLRQSPKVNEMEKVIFKCLAKQKADRYASIEALMRDLQSVKEGKPVKYKPTKKRSSGQVIGTLIVLAGAAIVFFIQVTTLGPKPSQQTVSPTANLPSDLQERAFYHYRERSYAQALPLLEYVAATARRTGNKYHEAFCYQCMGQCLLALKQYEDALPKYTRALDMMNKVSKEEGRDIQNAEMVTETKSGLITVLQHLSRKAEAEAMLRTLKIDKLQQLEEFYRNSNAKEDESRVAEQIKELTRLNVR